MLEKPAVAPGNCTIIALAPSSSFDALAGTGNMETLYRLASVKVDLRSYAQAGNVKGSAALQTEFAFRSRMSAPYRREAGCRT
jgi:hypothetical protein